jgi:hypothetical protein
MASERALYWSALGLFAITLLNGPVRRFTHWPEHLAAGYQQVANFHFNRSPQVETAMLALDDHPTLACERIQALQAQGQIRLAHIQADMARHQAALARKQAQKEQVLNLKRARLIRRYPNLNLRPAYTANDQTL